VLDSATLALYLEFEITDQLIHNRRRPRGAAQMRPDRGQRNLEEHEH
jgi:hypothetical protein